MIHIRTLRLPAAALLVAALALPAAAQELSPLYREWFEGPAGILLTPAERQAWQQQVTSDAAAEQFITLFWAQRDPDPATAENEFRRDFEQRVAFADERFKTEETRGVMTDRGRVFVLLGPPRRVERGGARGSGTGGPFATAGGEFGTGGSVSSGSGPGTIGRGATTERLGVSSEERWVYEKENLPKFVDRKRLNVRFVSKPGTDELVMDQEGEVAGYLAEARSAAIARPGITIEDVQVIVESASGGAASGGAAGGAAAGAGAGEADSPFSAWQGEAAAEGALTALRDALAGSAGGAGFQAHLDAGAFQTSDGQWIVPYQVSTTAAPATAEAQVVGELVDAAGTAVLSFQLDQPWRESKGQRYVKDTLVAPPGDYTLNLGLEGPGGAVVWSGSEKVTVPAAGGSDFWLSELVLSDTIFPMPEAQQMLEPYAWQGIAVVPRAGRSFRQGDLLWFYLHACNPVVGDDGEPTLRVTVQVEGPNKLRSPLQAEPTRAGETCWVIAQGLDLTAQQFPAGDYAMTVFVRDSEGAKTLTVKESFAVAAP